MNTNINETPQPEARLFARPMHIALTILLIVTTYVCGGFVGYWIHAGERDQLRSTIVSKEAQVDSLNKNVANIQDQVGQLEQTIRGLKQEKSKLTKDLELQRLKLLYLEGSRGGAIVNTVPQGATVKVGGDVSGTTPAVFQGLYAQKYPVVIEMENYESMRLEQEIKPQQFMDWGTIKLTHSKGGLSIRTEPSGATFELSGKHDEKTYKGSTPTVLTELLAGTYDLALNNADYPTAHAQVRVTSGQTAEFRWEYGAGTVHITSMPNGATINVDGKPHGQTPAKVNLQSGNHVIAVNHSNWPAQSKTVLVSKGKETKLEFDLQLAEVTVSSQPPNVMLWNGETLVGRTPVTLTLPAGQHSLIAIHPDYLPVTSTVHIVAHENKTVQVEMSKKYKKQHDASTPPADQYLEIYVQIREAENNVKQEKYFTAYRLLNASLQQLKSFRQEFPNYEVAVVNNRIKSVQQNMTTIESIALSSSPK